MTSNFVLMGAERGDHGDIRRVSAASDQDSADPALVVAGVKRVPAGADVSLKPSVEIHRRRVWRHADIAKVTIAITRGDIETTAKRDSKMSEVAADTDLLVHCLSAVRVGTRFRIAEAQAVMRVVANGLNLRVTPLERAESTPSKIG